MGTLAGHILPGSFFLFFGVWWGYCMLRSYYLCRREASFSGRIMKSGSRYRSVLLFNTSCSLSCCCCRKLPFEAILVVTSCTIGIIGEAVTGFEGGKFVHLGNGQHITMYFFFAVMGLCSILVHYRFTLPPDLDYVSALLAISVEGILFLYHLHGRTVMDVQVHIFLMYVVAASAVSGALEMTHKKNIIPALGRAFFTTLQGTWFIHVGFILYPPSWMSHWNETDHEQMMIITMVFTWHFAAVFLLFFMIGVMVCTRVKYMSKAQIVKTLDLKAARHGTSMNGIGLHGSNMDAEQTRNIIMDSDEDEL
uniref:Transmembrane protein 45B-like n=1 Tax=Hirondellea gigas TaxID=1518452 RepID=A0A6A7GAT9_9CRUS